MIAADDVWLLIAAAVWLLTAAAVWLLIAADRENQEHDVPYYIGLTVALAGGNVCASRLVHDRETIDGTRYDPGDYAIAVIWYLHHPLALLPCSCPC